MYSTGGNSRESPGGSVIPKDEPCQAINEETGDICGEAESLRILEEFRKLYETRISKVEEEPENPNVDRVSRKLEIMMDWVKDLGEQNVMLVRTVEELERAACSRVKVLEERLKQSSNLVAENISRAHQTDETLSVLTNRVSQLEKDEEFLQQKIDFLQSDIRGLLELIRRARRENCWSLEGITFFEIQPGDIPPPLDCSCAQETNDVESIQSLKLQVEQLQESEKKALLYQAELEDKLASLNKKVLLKEETLRKYISKLQNLRDNLKKRSSSANQIILASPATNTDLGSAIDTMADIVESTLSAKDLEVEDAQRRLRDVEAKLEEIVHEKNLESASLHRFLEEKCVVIRQTEYRLAHLQKESVETRDVLIAEVAEKHDLVLSLRKEVAALEERCRQMDVQMHFKDDIIKEMRKELKIARSKVKSDALQYRPVLEEFKACIAEAVSTTGDLCEEITDVVDIFNCRYQKYSELSSIIDQIQEHLASTRKNLSEVIDGLKLQEEQRSRENKKIAKGEMKLKDMKNMVNQARSEIFQNVGNVEDDREVFSQCGNTKMHTFDNLLDSIAAEVEQVLRDLQIREVLESNVTSILVELKEQLCASEFSFKDLQRKANDILLENDTLQSTFRKKMMNLNKLGEEFANVCKKMQDLSGICKIDKEQIGMRTEVRNHLEGNRELNKGVLERSQKCFNTFRVSKSFKLLQNAIHSTENGLQELGNEFKKLVDDKSSHSFISTGSVESALDVLRRYQEGMENCMVEVETLRNALSSKEKLLGDKDEIIMIQKDSIRMTQAELKDLYQKERQIDTLVTSKNCLEDKYSEMKRLWQEATEELQKLKCTSKGNRVKCRTQGVMCKVTTKDGMCITDEFENEVDSVDCSVLATVEELQGQLYECNCQVTQLKTTLKESARVKEELERGIDTLLRDNEDMKKQLQKYQVDFEILDEELKIEKEKQDERKASKGTACDLEGRKLHVGTQHGKNIDAIVAREMLQKHNIELEKLIVDTKDKQEELRVLQEVRKQFERIEDMEKMNDSLTKDLNDLLAEERNKDLKLAKCIERVSCLYEDIDVKKKEIISLYAQIACCEAAKCEQTRMIEQLEEKAQLYEQETDDCLFELNASKEIISILQNRVCSLRGLLKEKSDHMAKLQADYEMLKNENCILKTEATISQNKAREDVCNLNTKLKGLRFQLHLVEDNYRRVTDDYKMSQELLVKTAQREADLQHTITVMEKNFLCKLSAAERQEANLNEIVDKLNEELEIARCRLASKCLELCQTQSQLQVIQSDIQLLKEKLMKMEKANCCLSRQLKRCRDENVTLFERNKVLELDNIKYVTEIEDMHKSLLELRKECQLKAESLACMTAELNFTAASKSELCSESQYVVSCIRDWMEEQKRLVDTLALRLKQKQQRLSQLEFQNKTLFAMVKKLRRLNVSISQRLKRYRSTKSTCIDCPVPRLRVPCCRKVRICSSSSTCTRSLKKCGSIKTMRKTSTCGNSWWFPKMEHLLKEVRRSSQWRSENTTNCRTGNDPRLDESRDYGYQSSTSK